MNTEVDECLAGGGDMGPLMRALGMGEHAPGAGRRLPQSLKTTAISICLTPCSPMIIWWGEQFILLYNDAFNR